MPQTGFYDKPAKPLAVGGLESRGGKIRNNGEGVLKLRVDLLIHFIIIIGQIILF